MVQLVTREKSCCGCGACRNICPKDAIRMETDNLGFVYPKIDENKCIECNLCLKACDFAKRKSQKNVFTKIYAVVNKDEKMRVTSTSGGAFTAMAKWILDKNGVVYGCAWDNKMQPHHVGIDKAQDIKQFQGSKYVQSDIGLIYKDVKKNLVENKYVLFSGTPCQCAALRSYLGKSYEKLYCVELICHGVPSQKMFLEWVNLLEQKLGGKITDIHFRDKKLGWGALIKIDYITKGNKKKVKYLKTEESYYYYYFFYKGLFFRESCYSCKYADINRESDFTIGDYWGGQKEYPHLGSEKGISVLIATGQKAVRVLEELEEYMDMYETTLKNVERENGQLSHPSLKNELYDSLLKKYQKIGAEEFDKWYRKTHRTIVLKGRLKRMVPIKIKHFLIKIKNR